MRRSPQRSCVGCRAARDKRDLVRVVHTPEGRFVLDPTGKMPGRGAYLCPDPACAAAAVKRKSFDRAFRQQVPAEVAAELSRSIQEYLSARTLPAEHPAPGTAGASGG